MPLFWVYVREVYLYSVFPRQALYKEEKQKQNEK